MIESLWKRLGWTWTWYEAVGWQTSEKQDAPSTTSSLLGTIFVVCCPFKSHESMIIIIQGDHMICIWYNAIIIIAKPYVPKIEVETHGVCSHLCPSWSLFSCSYVMGWSFSGDLLVFLSHLGLGWNMRKPFWIPNWWSVEAQKKQLQRQKQGTIMYDNKNVYKNLGNHYCILY